MGVRTFPGRPGPTLLLAPVVALLVAGCGGGGSGGADAGTPPSDGTTRSASASASSAAPGPASGSGSGSRHARSGKPGHVTPTARAAASTRGTSGGRDGLPAAADGTDLGACADARCEVEVSSGDTLHLGPAASVGTFTVERIKGHVITWKTAFRGSSSPVRGEASDDSSVSCVNADCHGHLGRSTGRLTLNEVTVSFVAIGEDHAVARLSHPGT